ncbi:TonB-dependent receptor [Leptolyngbya sp. AN02str]|uniref:TonB-dependent receptor n=1 Tax=Leptolyngbya sp. AN02str TaxID=3423363 RepID=UPI003D317061
MNYWFSMSLRLGMLGLSGVLGAVLPVAAEVDVVADDSSDLGQSPSPIANLHWMKSGSEAAIAPAISTEPLATGAAGLVVEEMSRDRQWQPHLLPHGSGELTDASVPATAAIAETATAQAELSEAGSQTIDSSREVPSQPNSMPLAQTLLTDPVQPSELGAEAGELEGYRLELFPLGASSIQADNRSTLELAGRVVNADEEVIPDRFVVTLTATAGRFLGADYDTDRAGFQVQALNGEFLVRLQANSQAQRVRIRAAVERRSLSLARASRLNLPLPSNSTPQPQTQVALPFPGDELEAYTEVDFTTELRPSLFTGLLNLRIGQSGTNYWGSFRDFLDPDELTDGTEVDFDATLFGIGRLGEWSFLGAYNSSRTLNESCDGNNRLFRDDQSCESAYPVYGDSSTVDFLTPSSDSLFLRFQRDSRTPGAEPDFFMWGDYNTPEFSRSSQLFTATSRQLHGFRGNYSLGNFQVTGMFATDVEGFQRDTIAPDGTSGFYFLSRRLVIPGSETVYLELEELGRPGVVVEREALRRGPDYEIDYDRGTLLFRRPIQRTQFDPFGRSLVRRIVTSYQYEGGQDTNLYAGRLQYNFVQGLSRGSWAAVSYLNEDQGDRNYELYGGDFQIPIGETGQIVGEIARSSRDLPGVGTQTGTAYRLEANTPLGNSVRAQLLYRSVDETFANDATTSFRPGQTRLGAALAASVTPSTQLQLRYDFEENYGTSPLLITNLADLLNPGLIAAPGATVNNTLTSLSAGVLQRIGDASLGVEFVDRNRSDRAGNAFDVDSSQLVTRLDWPIAPDLTLRAQNDLTLSSEDDPIYPGRTALGLSWRFDEFTTLDLTQQFFYGGVYGDNSVTSIGTTYSRQLTEDTTLTGRYAVVGGISGMMGQQMVGINHGVALAPGLRLRVGYERIAEDILLETAAGQQFEQPYAVGQSASALGLSSGESYSIGLEYTDNPDFQASGRFERRTSPNGNNTVWTAAAVGRITPELTALLRFQQGNYANPLLTGRLGDTANLRLGLAYRNPRSDRFNALLSYRYRQNPSLIPDNILQNSGNGTDDHTFALEAIYAPSWRWEFYGKFALRHSNSYLANDLTVNNTIALGQGRVAYRLGYQWDIAGEARWIGQSETGFDEVGFATEVGYYATPDLRVGLGYSFGRANDTDFGDRSEGGLYLNISFKVNELFGGFGRQRIAPPQQQESIVQQAAGAPSVDAFLEPLAPEGEE